MFGWGMFALVLWTMIGMAAPSSQPKNFRGGVYRMSDGTGTPVTLVIPMGQGDLAGGTLAEYLNEPVIYMARTLIIGLGYGAPRPPQVSLTFLVGNLIGGTNTAPGSPLEFAVKKGAYSANVSTLGANRDMTFDLRLTIEGTAWGDSADETIDFEDCRADFDFAELGEGNKFSVTLTVLGSVVITNNTNTVTLSQAA